jgi:hypothetical protein
MSEDLISNTGCRYAAAYTVAEGKEKVENRCELIHNVIGKGTRVTVFNGRVKGLQENTRTTLLEFL